MPDNSLKGIIAMTISQLIFVLAWVGMKYAGKNLPMFEVLLFRGLFSMLLIIPLVHFRQEKLRGKDWLTLFLRSLFGYIALALLLYAVVRTEIGNAISLFNMLPIFVALLAPLILKEPFGKLQFLFIFVSFAGVAMIMKPDSNLFEGAGVSALLAGIFAALAMICLRKLRMTDPPVIVTFYFTLFIILASLPMALYRFVMPTVEEWGALAFAGIALGASQILLTKAYKLGRASTIAPFSYIFVIGSYFAGMLVFSEVPDALSLAGAAVIVASGIGIMLTAPKEQATPSSTSGARI